MASPSLGIVIAALGGLFALGSTRKKSAAAPSAGQPLDPGMPAEIDARVRTTLATVSDPLVLDQLASACDMARYRIAATALRARAAQLRGQGALPGLPLPLAPAATPGSPLFTPPGYTAPAPVSAYPAPSLPTMPAMPGMPPMPGPAWPSMPSTVPASAPPLGTVPSMPASPSLPIEELDPGIPQALAQAVAALLAKPDLTADELSYADQLARTLETQGYPRAGAKLRARLLAIKASHAGSDLLRQIGDLLTTPPTGLPPLPPGTPAGVPPIAGIPVGPPGTPIPTAPPPAEPGAAPPVAPLSRTYHVTQGDSPWTIAQRFTGDGNRFRELAAANPDKSARVLQGQIFEGETLTVPDAWPMTPGQKAPPVASTSASKKRPILRRGSSGPNVREWQKIVGVAVDGSFGPATETATKAWQTARGLTADGVVGPLTWAAATPSIAAAGNGLDPVTSAGVLDIIGARHHGSDGQNRHHG